MKRYGTVIVFKPGLTRLQAEEALQKLAAVAVVKTWDGKIDIQEFDDRFGGPVWYVP